MRRLPLLILFSLTSLTAWGQVQRPEDLPAPPEETPSDEEDNGEGSKLSGVPERLEVRIVDVTTVPAERDTFAATDRPTLMRYLIVQPKERVWNFPTTRPHQRRVIPPTPTLSQRLVRAEVLGDAAGRVLYDVILAKSAKEARGSLAVNGESQNDDYTQNRERLAAMDLRGTLGWESVHNKFLLHGDWRSRSLNWANPDTEGQAVLTPKDRGFRTVTADIEHYPESPEKGAQTWHVEGNEYRLDHGTAGLGEDRFRELLLRHGTDLPLGGRTMRVQAISTYRSLTSGARGSFATGLLDVSLKEPYFSFVSGVLEWQAGVAVYRDFFINKDDIRDPQLRITVPFTVGWTTQLGGVWSLKAEGGYGVHSYPAAEYWANDFSLVNPYLPLERGWKTNALLQGRKRTVEWGGGAEWRYAANLPYWSPMTVAADNEATAWTPAAIRAQIVTGRAFLRNEWSPRFSTSAEVSAENVSPRVENAALTPPVTHVPYRPALQAGAKMTWTPWEKTEISFGGDWMGKRYVSPVTDDTLEPYLRLNGRVSKTLGETVTLFGAGMTHFGRYRQFDGINLVQHSVGVGMAARF